MPKFGEVVTAKVTMIKKNRNGFDIGAMVKLSSGEEAFLPIKEISKDPNVFVKHVEDYMKLHEEIKVRVIGKNKKFNQWNVSFKRADEQVNRELQFQNKLERFLKDSKEKQQQLQKNKERKQGARKKKPEPK